MPAQRQIADDSPSSISQAAQIWGEGPEITPYATDFVPPAWFTDVSGVSGGIGTGSGAGTDGTGSSTQVPDSHDLEWTAGDSATFEFFFDGVCWTEEEPTNKYGLIWEMTTWHSQVRGASWVYWGYWWPPLWPGYRYITSFEVTSEFLADFNALGPGTMVHLGGHTIWPGEFVWDLQADTFPDPLDLAHYSVRTWLSGKATVRPQVTQPALYPPSHWPVYP